MNVQVKVRRGMRVPFFEYLSDSLRGLAIAFAFVLFGAIIPSTLVPLIPFPADWEGSPAAEIGRLSGTVAVLLIALVGFVFSAYFMLTLFMRAVFYQSAEFDEFWSYEGRTFTVFPGSKASAYNYELGTEIYLRVESVEGQDRYRLTTHDLTTKTMGVFYLYAALELATYTWAELEELDRWQREAGGPGLREKWEKPQVAEVSTYA